MTDYCLLFGPVISFVVSFLKAIPFVKNNPKWVALFFTIATGAFTALHGAPAGIDWSQIFTCVMTQFGLAVATHEVVTQPVAASVGMTNSSNAPPSSNATPSK